MRDTPGAARPPTPVLLTTPMSAILLDGQGDLALGCEMRGATAEWGGIIGQCVRLISAWRLGFWLGEDTGDLPSSLVDAETLAGAWRSHHAWRGLEIVHAVSPTTMVAGAVRTLRCTQTEGSPATLHITSTFAPYLLPVMVEGVRPHEFRVETSSEEIRIRQRGFGLSVQSSVAPSFLLLNRGSWIGGRWTGRVDEFGIEYAVPIAQGAPAEIRLLVHGGLDRTIGPARAAARDVLADPEGSAAATAASDQAWEEGTPVLRFPNAPELERAYLRARSSLRRLYAAPGDDLTGLVAGFPWYAALWGRDTAWMLPAVIWLGDFDWARRSIETMFRYQSRGTVPILGAEDGELPMQLAPGPIFLYGSSDTTLYYPELVDRWLRHAGASQLPDGWATAIELVVRWAVARSDPETGLLRNGGEAETIVAATPGFARVRYGIDAPDTTIWDSTDRRSHAIDIQVLWWRALGSALQWLGRPGDPGTSQNERLRDRLADTVRERYRWEAEGYLYDSLREGRPVEQRRPNALLAVSAGLFEPEEARRYVRRAAQGDLTTPWGVRTLSSIDPAYNPIAYHDGEVWTIATAWAADAALAAGEAALGLAYLTTIADRFEQGNGFAPECYRGDRPEPFDSCFLLGLSVAPFLTALFERLWGIVMDARTLRLAVRPVFPPDWTTASIERLRVGSGAVDLRWNAGDLEVRWSGPGTLSVETASQSGTVAPGGTGTFGGRKLGEPS